jgi:hypothetical protein
MATGLGLLVDRNAIAQNFESPAPRRNQVDLRLWKPLTNFGRQTGGPWFVVSNDAVFDRDLHSFHHLCACVTAQRGRIAE